MRNLLVVICLTFALFGCKHNVPFAYKIDVQQGNVLDETKLAQLKAGMSKEQVDYLLGMTISRDTFKQDRWDYVYYNKPSRQPLELKRLVINFDEAGNVKTFTFDEPLAAQHEDA